MRSFQGGLLEARGAPQVRCGVGAGSSSGDASRNAPGSGHGTGLGRPHTIRRLGGGCGRPACYLRRGGTGAGAGAGSAEPCRGPCRCGPITVSRGGSRQEKGKGSESRRRPSVTAESWGSALPEPCTPAPAEGAGEELLLLPPH